METITADIVELGGTAEVDAREFPEAVEMLIAERVGMIAKSDWVSPFLYIGSAEAGTAEDAVNWKITRIQLDSLYRIVQELEAVNVKWSDRLTIIY